MTIADTPMANDLDGSSGIYFCNLCNKPINSESAFKRHVVYCRRTLWKPKKRKRSCFVCQYEKPIQPLAGNEMSSEFQEAWTPEPSISGPSTWEQSTPEPSGSSPSDSIGSPGHAFPELQGFEIATMLSECRPPRPVTELRTDPRHQASAMILLEYIRGLPFMMSRRETFPLFVHGQWHEPDLPEIFANCVHVSRLWLTRNASPQDRELFESTIEGEKERLINQISTATQQELIASLTMQNIYTLFTVLENDASQGTFMPELEARMCDIDRMTYIARQCFACDAYGPFDIDTIGNPNETWEEFIYAESRRRCALFWFIVSRVVGLHYGAQCPPIVGYRGLSLPAPETLWNARTKQKWEEARAEIRERSQRPLHSTTLRTVGDLIDSRACTSDPDQRDVSNWLASCDKLGLMLVVALTMI
ncbi:hypothetical protein NUW58_g6756 [Xylaria curta]|uniref:Uncharacterized protein n=1 Tax=Xylaria curta TaxID=42375 RepID=A0ACC1NPG2_9PEZI|nr:hypothetical protein NUW58_g6756 [Xylaria curta]